MSPGELAAVLSALAGVRHGDAVAGFGLSPLAHRALAAGCGGDLVDPQEAPEASCAVVAAGAPEHLAAARRLLRPGGRLVAVAEDELQAREASHALSLDFRFAEAVGPVLVWSAQASLVPPA